MPMSPIDIMFYTSSLTLISVFWVINTGLKNTLGIKYSVLFLLVLILLWAAEGWIYPVFLPKIAPDDLRPVYWIGLIATSYGFLIAPSAYEAHGKDWFKTAALGGLWLSCLSGVSLLLYPSSIMPVVLSTLLIMLLGLHVVAACSWKTYTHRFNWLAFVAPVIALLGTVVLLYGSFSEGIPPQLIAYSFRGLFAIVCVLVLGTLFLTYLDLQKAHANAVMEALAASEQEALRAQQLIEMEREYNRAREIADQHARQLSSASHDIRQPIASIRAELDAMMTEIPKDKRERFEHIFMHVDALIASFKTPTPNDGHHEQDLEDIPVSLIFSTLQQLFIEEAKNKGITLTFMPSALIITASAISVLRVASNLLANAINHAQASRILIGARRSGGKVKICVLDNGQGIPIEDRDSLFIAGAKGAKSEGSGLGLSIVKEISDTAHIQLQVRSVPGSGTSWELLVARQQKY